MITAAPRRPRSTIERMVAGLARLLFALFITGGALPAGGPSAVHGFDIVEEDEKSTQSEDAHPRALRQSKRSSNGSGGLVVLEVPSLLDPTHAAPQPPTWMRPRRTPLPDDDDTVA